MSNEPSPTTSHPMQVMASILDEVNQALIENGTKGKMCSMTIMPGDTVPADYGTEDCGGMFWVRLTSANTTVGFPATDVTVNNCTHSLAFNAEIGILRPAKIPEANKVRGITLPTDEEQWEEANLQLSDMLAMHGALKAVGQDWDDFIIQQYMPIGPDGGIVGGQWTFVFGEE